jgi:hypothetical protein
MNRNICSLVAGILICLYLCFSAQTSADDLQDSISVLSKEEVLQLAKEYMGVQCLKDYDDKNINEPVLVQVNKDDDQTPFFHSKITSEPVWQVLFKKVPIRYQEIPAGKGSISVRDFCAYVDPESGALLKIMSSYRPNKWLYRNRSAGTCWDL